MITNLPLSTATLVLKLPTISNVPDFAEKSSTKKLIVRAIAKLMTGATSDIIYFGHDSQQAVDAASSIIPNDGIVITIHILGKQEIYNSLPTFLLVKKFKQALQNNSEHIVIENPKKGDVRFIDIYTRTQETSATKAPIYQLATPSYDFHVSN